MTTFSNTPRMGKKASTTARLVSRLQAVFLVRPPEGGTPTLAVLTMLAAGFCASARADEFQLLRRPVPVFNDGAEGLVMEFEIKCDAPRTLAAVELARPDSAKPVDIVTTSLARVVDGKPDTVAVSGVDLRLAPGGGGLELAVGAHRFQILVKLREGADLLTKSDLRLTRVDFTEGDDLTPPDALATVRPAFRIHRTGEHGSHTFRIPGLARAKDGALLAVYDMRHNSSKDLQEDIDIGLSRSEDGGQTWAAPVRIMDMGEYGGLPQKENGCSDPNILVDGVTGEILVSALWTHAKPKSHQWKGRGSEPGFEIGKTAQFVVVKSADHGRTWSPPENWTQRVKKEEWFLFAPAPGNGITLRDGTLVLPSQGRDANGFPFSNLMWSADRGKTWTVSAPARDNTTECAVAELSDGRLLLNMRDNRNGALKGDDNGRALSVTADRGQTWTTYTGDHAALPEPVCMGSMISVKLPGGRDALLFSNPRDKERRRNITIQASTDDGQTWPEKHRVLLDDGAGFGYSSLTSVDGESVGILYESSVGDMIFQKLRLSELTE